MTLQVSGAISLDNIQTEFGGANPISLSEYYAGGAYVPAGTGSIPSSGIISIGTFYGTSSAPTYWIIDSAKDFSYYYGDVSCDSAVDSNGKLYIVGQAGFPFNDINAWFLVKTQQKPLTIESTVIYNSNQTGSYSNGSPVYVLTDSSNNVYATYLAPVTVGGVSTTGISLAKFNNSGTLQWSRTIGDSAIFANVSAYAGGLCFDSSGNIYITGSISYDQNIIVAKYNNSGTLQWIKLVSVSGTLTAQLPYGSRSISIDSSDILYLSFLAYNSSNSQRRPAVMAFDTSGTVITSRQINVFGRLNGGAYQAGHVACSNGFRYLASSLSVSNVELVVERWSNVASPVNSGRNVIRATSSTGARIVAASIANDSSNNIYVVANFVVSGGYQATGTYSVIIKYNSSLTLQWQRSFTSVSGKIILLNSVKVDSATTFIVTGKTSSVNSSNSTALTMRLPLDGSKTGTYGDYIYSASSLVVTTNTDNISSGNGTGALNAVPSTTQSIDNAIVINSSRTLTSTITGI